MSHWRGHSVFQRWINSWLKPAGLGMVSLSNHKLRILLILFTSIFCTKAFAGELTQKVQTTYQKISSFEAHFLQKTQIPLLDRNIEEKGKIIFQKPAFLVHYEGSGGKEERQYLSDGKTLWIYRPDDHEAQAHPNTDLLSEEALVFLGDLGAMTRAFLVSEKGSVLTLVPKKKRTSTFQKVILTIDPQTFFVNHVLLFPKSGNRSEYIFQDIKTNQAYPQNVFRLPKGVKVIENTFEP